MLCIISSELYLKKPALKCKNFFFLTQTLVISVNKSIMLSKDYSCLLMISFGVFYMQASFEMAFHWNVCKSWVTQRTFSSVIVLKFLCMVTITFVMYSKTQFQFTCNIWQWLVVVYLLEYTIFIGQFSSQHHKLISVQQQNVV